MGFATSVYDADGNLVETLVMAGANRQEATYEELPKNLVNAFVAIEDERFWKHNGVDTRSIMRAVVGVLRGTSSSGGGSTITQQLIKNNLFNGGREKSFGEKLTRKIQEQYLALKLEQMMSKEEILTNYLNTINLGRWRRAATLTKKSRILPSPNARCWPASPRTPRGSTPSRGGRQMRRSGR